MYLLKSIAVLSLCLGLEAVALAETFRCTLTEDKMSRGVTKQCRLTSTNNKSTFVVENKYGEILAYVSFGNMLRNHKTATVRWGEESAVKISMSRSTDFKALFFKNPRTVIQKLAKSKTFMIESDTYARGVSIDVFNISDGKDVADFVLPTEADAEEDAREAARNKALRDAFRGYLLGATGGTATSNQQGGGGDAGYAGLVRACVKPGVSFSTPVRSGSSNPTAEYRVYLKSNGEISSLTLRRSSGIAQFDAAVETGISQCSPFPKTPSGRYPTYIDIDYSMY